MKKEKEFHNYIVETANYHKKIKGARTLMGGAVSAFIMNPPKNPSILTRVKEDITLSRTNKQSQWHYIDTKEVLKKAGYLVE